MPRPMLPIAHGLLDEGHTVSFLAHDETVKKIKSLGLACGAVNVVPQVGLR